LISVQVLVADGDEGKLQAEGGPGLAGLTEAWSLVQEFGAVFAGRPVVDRAVGTDVVVFIPEGIHHALGLEQIREELAVEAFVAEAAVEALVDPVLPRAAGFDEAGLNARKGQPRYGYVLIFIVLFLDNIGVPMPGKTILFGAGIILGKHESSPWLPMAAGTAACFLGGICPFLLGRQLGRGSLENIPWLHLKPGKL
jgi:hypothetical protein